MALGCSYSCLLVISFRAFQSVVNHDGAVETGDMPVIGTNAGAASGHNDVDRIWAMVRQFVGERALHVETFSNSQLLEARHESVWWNVSVPVALPAIWTAW
jgi:hypothetical protein